MRGLFRIAGRFRPARLIITGLVLMLAAGCSFGSGGDGRIVYVSDTDGDREIYLLDPESGESSPLTSNKSADEDPRWSADGEKIAYVSLESGDREISVIDREGQDLRRLTDSPGADGSPRWSPAEQTLAYVSESQEGGKTVSQIYSISVEDREVTPVTFEGTEAELGDWSPDGQWIVFYNQEPEEERGLWLRNPEGVNQHRITKGEDTEPAWSPNGKYIAFVRNLEEARVIYMARQGKEGAWDEEVEVTRLTNSGADDFSPVWHPDSKTLAFVSTRDGNAEIYTMQATNLEEEGSQRRLTSNNTEDGSPVWSPNGKQLAFVTRLFGSADILVMNADGSEQRRLTKNGGDDVSPDW